MKAMIHSVPVALLLALCLPTRAQDLSQQPQGAPNAVSGTAARAIVGLGVPIQAGRLAAQRGGFDLVKNDMQLAGSVAGNAAIDVSSGGNFIGGGAFANASGLPTVIQNTGSNVLIQNATVINVQFQ